MGLKLAVGTTGEVVPKPTFCDFEWTIPNFVSLSEECYKSSSFSFAGASWKLFIFPNGSDESVGWVAICLARDNIVPPIALKVSFAIQTSDGKKDLERNYTEHVIEDGYEMYACDSCITREDLLKRASELLPSKILTVICTVKYLDASENASAAATSLCSYCKNTLDDDSVASHEKKCTERPITCPECSDVVLLLDWYGHECQLVRTEEEEALIRDLKKMLSEGKNHDLILKAGNKEFRVHQNILSSRSHVLESVLNHDMKEKYSGIIDMPDCDPEAMEIFLSYIYTGKFEALDERHMLGLYYIADKYDAQGLKKKCRNFIKKSLSHSNICDVIQLAVNHSDSELQEYATEYFLENAKDITVTAEWQSFLKDNTKLGNELIVKSFQKNKS